MIEKEPKMLQTSQPEYGTGDGLMNVGAYVFDRDAISKRLAALKEYDMHDRSNYNYAKPADSSPAAINAAKYGVKSDDDIARQYKESITGGNYFCKGNIEKYITRFCKEGSPKAGNVMDLIKAKDFLQRMIEMHQDKVKPEVIER